MRVSLAILMCLLLSSGAIAEVQQHEAHAVCAAANAILSSQMEDGMMRDVVTSEAQRHADAARNFGVSDAELEQLLRAIGDAYNQGSLSWQEIADLGEDCTRL